MKGIVVIEVSTRCEIGVQLDGRFSLYFANDYVFKFLHVGTRCKRDVLRRRWRLRLASRSRSFSPRRSSMGPCPETWASTPWA